MAAQNVIIDVPLIAKKARDAGNQEPTQIEVALPNGQKINLQIYLFGTPREPIQAGASAGSCNGICW